MKVSLWWTFGTIQKMYYGRWSVAAASHSDADDAEFVDETVLLMLVWLLLVMLIERDYSGF